MAGVDESAADVVSKASEGRHGKSVEVRQPDVAIAALTSLATGGTISGTSRETGLDRGTLHRLRDDNKEWLAEWRAKELRSVAAQARKARELATMKLDELLEDDEARAKVSVKDLAVTQAVFLDKAERLAGAPDVKVEVDHKFGLSDAKAWLERARDVSGRVVGEE